MLVSVSLTKITNYTQNRCCKRLWAILLTEQPVFIIDPITLFIHSFCTPFLSCKNYLFGLRVSVITIGNEHTSISINEKETKILLGSM